MTAYRRKHSKIYLMVKFDETNVFVKYYWGGK